MGKKSQDDISFEDGLKELEEIVRKLEAGGLSLDAAIENYKKGQELKAICEKKLSEAKLSVEKIISASGGNVKTEPFED